MEKLSYVYIMASGMYGTLYTGVTSDLIRRVWKHRENVVDGYTKEYGVKHLVWFEQHTDIYAAITREKQIKKWRRDWKIALIQAKSFMAGFVCGYLCLNDYRCCPWIPAFAGMTDHSARAISSFWISLVPS